MKDSHALKLERLKALVDTCRNGSRMSFQNSGIVMIADLLETDPDFRACLNLLPPVQPELLSDLRGAIPSHDREGIMNTLKAKVSTYTEQISLCRAYIKEASTWKNNLVVNACSFQHETFTAEKDRVMCAIASCIDPLIGFIEYEFAKHQNLFRAFERYKVLCEWYDRDELSSFREVELTQHHLSKFLFNEGFTYVLSETNVPSGRMDNYIQDEAVVAEAKFFDGTSDSIKRVLNQAEKRLQDLNLSTGYCVIYCRDKKVPVFTDASGNDGHFVFFDIPNGKRLFFITIRLSRLQSTESIESIEVQAR